MSRYLTRAPHYAAVQFRNQKRRVRGPATLFFRREVVVGLNQQRSTVGWK